MELLKAKNIAIANCYRLFPFCDKINIVGSVRRQKPDPNDTEIICLPKIVAVVEYDLFGEAKHTFSRSPEFEKEVLQLGKVIKGKPSGIMMQIELPEGIMLDLFMPQPHDYYRQMAIRTGSSQYSNLVIATAWEKLGWCGTEDGLRRISECEEIKLPENKSKWICKIKEPLLPPEWENEESFFKFLQVPFLSPIKRSM